MLTLVLTEKLVAKVGDMMAEELASLSRMLKDYPQDAELANEYKEGMEALRDFEAAVKR